MCGWWGVRGRGSMYTYGWQKKESEVAQSCLTLCDPVDCSPPGFSDHGILQARILEWVATSFFRGSSWPRDWTQVSHIAGRCFSLWATRGAVLLYSRNQPTLWSNYHPLKKTHTHTQKKPRKKGSMSIKNFTCDYNMTGIK